MMMGSVTARSAISTLHMDCGNSALMNRFMKGIFNVRPSLPLYTCTYDVKVVLDYLASLHLQTLSLLDVVNASNSSLWLPYPVLVYICYAL